MVNDKLTKMFDQQKQFMELLRLEREFPEFPVDLSKKEGQQILKKIAHECMHELFEANQMLKNSKDHRITQDSAIDKDLYLEELSDALHYFFEIGSKIVLKSLEKRANGQISPASCSTTRTAPKRFSQ